MDIGLLAGLANALSLANMAYALIGCLLGTLVGSLPGLGPASAMAILLPLAVHLPPEGSIIIMAGIYYGAMYGGSTTAILMNIPGEVSSVITAVDGFAMTKAGRAGEALGIAAIGSFIAGIFGTLCIALIGPKLADLALNFGPPEYLGLVIFSMSALVSFAGPSLISGVALGIAGMWLASIGTDPLTGTQRLNLGTIELMKGFDVVPVLVGLFGIAEVLTSLQQGVKNIHIGPLGSWLTMIPRGAQLARGLAASVRGTVLGFVLGLLPGMLPALTAYLAYDVEQRISKTPEQFGQGAIEGVAAPEAANNATAMAGFIPLLSLGIPTSPALAVLFGTLLINGLTPGPMLFQNQPLLTWTVIGSMLIANTALLVLSLPLVGLWARIAQIPYSILGPFVLAICLIGAYSPRNTMFDVWVAIGFGIIRYLMRRLELPLAPLVLGFLLGPLFEHSLRQSISIAASPLDVIGRPITAVLLAASIAVLVTTVRVRRRSSAVKKLITASTNEV